MGSLAPIIEDYSRRHYVTEKQISYHTAPQGFVGSRIAFSFLLYQVCYNFCPRSINIILTNKTTLQQFRDEDKYLLMNG
uniref:Uncharacterized protein n=1 Tax=Octopus bimaculoides TaxID=37653 RepID=A0A0L8I9M2_OCTBM